VQGYSLAVQSDGKILVGGFASSSSRLVRVNPDGSLDSGFNPNPDDIVTEISLQADGRILIAGFFLNVGGISRPQLARLNSDGSLDTAFDPDPVTYVESVAPQANGEILVAGNFDSMFGQPANGLALLFNDSASQNISIPDLTRVIWTRTGTVPEVAYTTFEVSTDNGASWTLLGNGTRVSDGWQLSGLNLPASAMVRTRGRTRNGEFEGGSGLMEQTLAYSFLPQISVEQPAGLALTAGSSTVDFGSILAGTNSSRTFTVRNSGNADLTGLGITIDGANPSDFEVTTSPAPLVAGGGSTTFTVQFTAGGLGLQAATLHLANNVPASSPFDILLKGTGLTRLQNWRQTWFGTTDPNGAAADNADPDGDGVSNLLEFATGSDPTKSNNPPGSLLHNGSNLEFTYQRGDAAIAEGVTFIVEWSDTLGAGTWSQSGVNETILSDDGTMQQVKAVLPDGGGAQRFVHLRVTH
jgi:uncharacterized delta-60 repeat protein